MQGLADQLFKTMGEFRILESRAEYFLMRSVGMEFEEEGCEDTWIIDDITFDDYDYSFEFKNTRPGWEPTKDHLKQWKAAGFWRCWICYEDGTEKYYALK